MLSYTRDRGWVDHHGNPVDLRNPSETALARVESPRRVELRERRRQRIEVARALDLLDAQRAGAPVGKPAVADDPEVSRLLHVSEHGTEPDADPDDETWCEDTYEISRLLRRADELL